MNSKKKSILFIIIEYPQSAHAVVWIARQKLRENCNYSFRDFSLFVLSIL